MSARVAPRAVQPASATPGATVDATVRTASRPRRRRIPLLAIALLAAAAAPWPLQAAAATGAVAARAAARSPQPWPLPSAEAHAAQPSLVAHGDGLLLSWIERHDGQHRLRFARAGADGVFAPAQTIAEGSDWFVNWADFPSLLVLENGDLVTFVLQKSAALPYAYDLQMRRSRDGGAHWSKAQAVHDDGTATEHGFASLWPAGGDRVGIAWLDGRDTAAAADAHDPHGHGGGAMTLRAAEFGRAGKRAEWALDGSTCDCCQTDAALSAAGPVLVYRDRDQDELRDIAIVRQLGAGAAVRWSAPALVHADRWKMPACPVNGPAVDARGARVYVAWYTGAGAAPSIRLARSDDSGGRFGAPLQLAAGPEVLGRVDVQAVAGAAWVSWLREDVAGGQSLWLARIADSAAGEAAADAQQVATLQVRGRASGFPRMAVQGAVAHLVWTDVVDGAPRLRGARVRLD